MSNEYGFTMEEYLIRSAVNGVVEHLVKASVDEEGNVSFYITDASTDPYVCRFDVLDNFLVTYEGDVIG